MKNLFLFIVLCSLAGSSRAQLTVGSLAPDWTYKDINNNSHHLYNYLDSGYTVIIDVSATWCGPCWGFHNTHVAEALTDHYGPNGTITPKKIKFFFFESDNLTTSADLHGLTAATQGDWVTGANYPIIDTTGLKMPYFVTGYPTYFVICPNKRIAWTSAGNGSGMESFWVNLMNSCPLPSAGKDASLISTEPIVNLCGNTVLLQNMSAQPLTSATIKMYNGSTLAATQPWTGSLPAFGITDVTLPGSAYTAGQGQLTYKVETTGDNNAVNDSVKSAYSLSLLSGDKISIEVHTDNQPFETSWILYDGANIIDQKAYIAGQQQQVFTYNYTVPSGACLRFDLDDTYSDGMTSGTSFTINDDGWVKIYDGANNALITTIPGPSFQRQTAVHYKAAGNPAGVENIFSGQDVSLYPNPAADFLDISVPPHTLVVTVLDLTGRKIYEQAVDDSYETKQLKLHLEVYPAGLYTCIIQTDRGSVAKSFEVVK